MANDTTKTRGTQLIRTDDKVRGQVTFYRRDVEDAAKARIATIDVMVIPQEREIPDPEGGETPLKVTVTLAALGFPSDHPVIAAAVHGYTQNVLDSSNKLDGQARVDFIVKACSTIQAGGWASAPQDDAKIRENAEAALRKMYAQMGLTPEAINAAVKAAMDAAATKKD